MSNTAGLNITKTHLNATEVAKRIRADLKKAFPTTKFSVRSSSFSQGSSVDVSYIDGPTVAQVESLMNRYGGRGFDGSNDSTYFNEVMHLTENGPVIFWTGAFLNAHRKHSAEAIEAAAATLRTKYAIPETFGLNDCDYGIIPLNNWCGSLRIAAINLLEGRDV